MGWLGNLIGTEKAVNNIVDKDNGLLTQMGNWIGGMQYTPEEQAEANATTREWGIRQLEALAPFKVVQRIIAMSVTAFWVFLGINIIVAIWIEALFPDIDVVMGLTDFAYSQYAWWPVLAVLGLYFTGGVLPGKSGTKK